MNPVFNYISQSKYVSPVLFRSGVANLNDFQSTLAADAAIGTSLFYCDLSNNTTLFASILEQTRRNKVFLDNGLISICSKNEGLAKKGLPLLPLPPARQVLEQYLTIAKLLGKNAKNLTVVCPDNPIDQDGALKIIEDNADLILEVASMTDMIIPIHHCHVLNKNDSYVDHAKRIFSALRWDRNIRLGIPTKLKIGTEFGDLPARVSLAQIKSLLAIKAPRCRRNFVRKVHFLALSEVSKPQYTFEERMGLCAEHSVMDVSVDTQRFAALLGSKGGIQKGKTQAQRNAREYIRSESKNRAMLSQYFLSFDWDKEVDESRIDDLCRDAISNDPAGFVKDWELLLPDWPLSLADAFQADRIDAESVLSAYEEVVYVRFPFVLMGDFLNAMKSLFISDFTPVDCFPTSSEARFKVISEEFKVGDGAECQLPIDFDSDPLQTQIEFNGKYFLPKPYFKNDGIKNINFGGWYVKSKGKVVFHHWLTHRAVGAVKKTSKGVVVSGVKCNGDGTGVKLSGALPTDELKMVLGITSDTDSRLEIFFK
ncbi:hypothetical protein [Photobacterium leiognathi]|uniref:hypothetical protein n=1 Tax=Photobacterium leiognathi TaxID=553611 RepID=UPI002980B6D5|nr:hypothetical protein [Photobacterium leiognathi]